MSTDNKFMQRCYELAEVAKQEGESPVGSVVVKNGVIIGEASEKSRQLKDITRHAEALAIINALKNAGSVEGATLYTNVEPCLLCSYVIRHHKIAEVVFASHSGELGGTHAPYNLLTADDIASWTAPPAIVVYKKYV